MCWLCDRMRKMAMRKSLRMKTTLPANTVMKTMMSLRVNTQRQATKSLVTWLVTRICQNRVKTGTNWIRKPWKKTANKI